MRSRLLQLCALSGCFLLLGCPDKPRPAPPKKKSVPFKAARPVSLPALRTSLQGNYRLKPDRRLLEGVADVHHFITGKPRAKASAEFAAGKWTLKYQKADVGTLPELPDFADGLDLLTQWADKLAKETPLDLKKAAADGPADLLAGSPITALQKAQERWQKGEHTTGVLHQAVDALAAAAFLTPDVMEVADVLPQRALAYLAVARAGGLGDTDLARDETLLAQSMGYSAAAAKAAAALPAADPLRLFATQDDKRLRKLAAGKKAPLEARYLLFLRLIALRDAAGAEKLMKQGLSSLPEGIPVLRARFALAGQLDDTQLRRALPGQIFTVTRKELSAPDPAPPKATLGAFEDALPKSAAAALPRLGPKAARPEAKTDAKADAKTDPFADPEVVAAPYRGLMYSTVYSFFLPALLAQPPAEAAKGMADLAGETRAAPVRDLRTLLDSILTIHGGKQNEKQLVDRFATLNLPSFGALPYLQILREISFRVDPNSTGMSQSFRRMAGHLDTRLAHRDQLGGIAHEEILALNLWERLSGSIAKAAPQDYPAVLLAVAEENGDSNQVKALLHVDGLNPLTRTQALESLAVSGALSEAMVVKEYRRLLKVNKDDWDTFSAFLAHLEKKKDYKTAQKTLQDWLVKNKALSGPRPLIVRVALARVLDHAGKYAEGLKALQPALLDNSGNPQVSQRAALLMAALGKKQDADDLAKARLKKLPTADSVALRAEVLWRSGDNEAAKDALATPPVALQQLDWRNHVGKRFAEVFTEKPAAAGLAAFEVLRKLKVAPAMLAQMAQPVAQAKDAELAYNMLAQLQIDDNMELLLKRYQYFKAWKDEATALAWLKDKLTEDQMPSLAVAAFSDRLDGLLWDAVREPQGKSQAAEMIWLMRAASVVRGGSKDEEHTEQVRKHFEAKEQATGYHNILGRYLIGLADEKTVMAQAVDTKKACEVAFYLGLRAQGEGKYAEAVEWYRVAQETGLQRVFEHRLAVAQLRAWKEANQTLSRLAAGRL